MQLQFNPFIAKTGFQNTLPTTITNRDSTSNKPGFKFSFSSGLTNYDISAELYSLYNSGVTFGEVKIQDNGVTGSFGGGTANFYKANYLAGDANFQIPTWNANLSYNFDNAANIQLSILYNSSNKGTLNPVLGEATTSGNYSNFEIIDGIKYEHKIPVEELFAQTVPWKGWPEKFSSIDFELPDTSFALSASYPILNCGRNYKYVGKGKMEPLNSMILSAGAGLQANFYDKSSLSIAPQFLSSLSLSSKPAGKLSANLVLEFGNGYKLLNKDEAVEQILDIASEGSLTKANQEYDNFKDWEKTYLEAKSGVGLQNLPYEKTGFLRQSHKTDLKNDLLDHNFVSSLGMNIRYESPDIKLGTKDSPELNLFIEAGITKNFGQSNTGELTNLDLDVPPDLSLPVTAIENFASGVLLDGINISVGASVTLPKAPNKKIKCPKF